MSSQSQASTSRYTTREVIGEKKEIDTDESCEEEESEEHQESEEGDTESQDDGESSGDHESSGEDDSSDLIDVGGSSRTVNAITSTLSSTTQASRASSIPPRIFTMAEQEALRQAYDFQVGHLQHPETHTRSRHHAKFEQTRTTPLFSAKVRDAVEDMFANHGESSGNDPGNQAVFPQYGLLAARQPITKSDDPNHRPYPMSHADRIFLNVNTPWSAFICGSQGSGKSHTLSCMLENCLLPSLLGKLPQPLAGMVFHYDKFTSFSSGQLCEAAYLCSSGIPVRVLVSPSNFWAMEAAYSNLPGLPIGSPKPHVIPMLLKDKHLNIQRMMNLMAVSDKEGPMPLYMETICRILRSMAEESHGAGGLNYQAFKLRLVHEAFDTRQNGPLRLRLDLLESFMERPPVPGTAITEGEEGQTSTDIWTFDPRSLTIVDLSCPFVDESAACVLFDICLGLFLQDRGAVGRVVALDEAHKFMTNTSSASSFTENLLSVIRQQRHLATRVIIATQEPTVSPKLLDLSSMTIVHRFASPDWLRTLKGHLAGVSEENGEERNVEHIWKTIVELEAGEALLFSPAAILDMKQEDVTNGDRGSEVTKLGMNYIKIRVRKRLTADGGRSILAT